MPKYKVLQVCNSDHYLNHFLSPLIVGLNESGMIVDCVCSVDAISSTIVNSTNKTFNINFPDRILSLSYFRSIYALSKILKNNNYDVVQSHNRNASSVARISSFLLSVPINLYTAHGFYFHDRQSKIAKYLTVQLERILSLITTYTFSQSSEDTNFMIDKGYISKAKILTINNGIPIERFLLKNKRPADDKLKDGKTQYKIVATGRIVRNKGFADLIKATKLVLSSGTKLDRFKTDDPK